MAEQFNFWNMLEGEEERETAPAPVPAKAKPTTKPASKRPNKSARAPRKCLGPCGKTFMSNGPGQRFCGNCRRLEAFADGAAEYTVQF